MAESAPFPKTIGRHEVKRPLGAGAMGAVYLAEDPRLKRKLAIKVVKLDSLRSEQERHECLLRFQREAEISALLQHPGIVMIFDYGDEPGVGPYLAMEYVHGKTLDAVLKTGDPLSLKDKLRIGAGVAEALDHAHARGIIHRDVKPGNIMLGEGGRPKLMDFGIAKREDAHLTQTGTFLGTPSYASPEQIREGVATTRSDVFSLGVVMFELLAGTLPFPGNSINTILYRIVNEPPVEVKPPVLGLLPEAWDRIFSRVLAKNPELRHPNCTAFIRDLVESATELQQADQAELQGYLHVGNVTMVAPILTTTMEGQIPTPTQNRPMTTVHEPTSHGRKLWLTTALGLGAVAVLAGAYMALQKFSGESVLVRSIPDKATLLRDGKSLGTTPFPGTFKAGERLRCEHKGFQPKEWVVKAGEKVASIELEPILSQETLRSNPPGASAVLDGRKLDRVTPVEVTWNQGQRHELALTKGNLSFSWTFMPGDVPGAQTYALTDGSQETEVGAVTGFLKLAGTYAVRVKADGRDLGELKPGARLPLDPGTHKLELSNPKVFYRETRTGVTVAKGQVLPLQTPALAQVTVSTFGAKSDMVIVDGQATAVESDGFQAIPMVRGSHVFGVKGSPATHAETITGDQVVKFRI